MDYEKKYNELVERIKEFHEVGNAHTKAQMEIILPELAESENEKIRKEMIDYFSQFKEDGIRGVDITPWIAYLERQKNILQEKAQNITTNMLEDRIEGIQHELIEFLSNTVDASWVDIIESADSYAERIKNIIEKQKEQKPAEWSEEDETALGDLMWCIEQARKSAKNENDMGNIWFAENWVKKRIKSLRPQSHWKPSEEQMDVFVDALYYLPKNGFKDPNGCIESLYNDLKKL